MELSRLLHFLSLVGFILATGNTRAYSNASVERSGSVAAGFGHRGVRAGLLSFDPIGKHVALGLDFQLPFLRVPFKRRIDQYGNEPALLNVNSAAVITTGILAGGGLLLALLMRTIGGQGREAEDADAAALMEAPIPGHEASRRYDIAVERQVANIFEQFKLVYNNATGERVETTLPKLFATVEETFLENDIDLAACMQKSICSLVYKSSMNVRSGSATGTQKIVDGLTNTAWLMQALPHSTLREAIDAGKLASSVYCDVKYPLCKWSAPEEKLTDLLRTYVNFT